MTGYINELKTQFFITSLDEPRYLLNTIPSELKLQGEEIPYGINLVKALGVSDEFVANQKVCIVDTGFDISHPDLPSGGNVSGNDNSGYEWNKDGNGHGSHLAGTIAGIGGNGIGVVGVNRNGAIGLHIERVFNDNGNWIWASTIIKAVSNCVAAGSNIISMSLGGPFSMNSERDLFESLLKDSNVLIIAAAGNAGSNAYSYPASYPSVMSVAAIDSSKRICSFSQRNDQVDISAPGLNVLSVKSGGGYVSYSGTSMATPHVSGVAALVWSHFPNKSAMEIRDALMFSAEDLGSQGRDDSFGYGLVQADKAYEWIKEGYTLSPTVAPTPELPCFDFGNYVNGRGKDCEWFTRGIFNYRCFLYGDSRPNNDGVTPNEACCVCGGGTTGGSSSPTKSPTMSPTASPTACVDEDNWLNSRGKGCEWYGYWRCLWYGGKLENEGLVANEACCVCK